MDNECCCRWHCSGRLGKPVCEEHYSMRKFLEDKRSFCWPNDKRRNGLYYKFDEDNPMRDLMKHERRLTKNFFSKTPKARSFVDQWSLLPDKQEDLCFSQPFVIKRLASGDDEDQQTTNKEIQAMTDLRFPHVSALLATLKSEGCLHIVTFPAGCCDLGDLFCAISERKKPQNVTPADEPYIWLLTADRTTQLHMLMRYFLCLCQALAYLSSTRILVRHRDIKPANIIIDLYGNVILTDFGLSSKFTLENSKMITQDGTTVGTQIYSPPEIFDPNHERDARTDVWSLGCVFLEMATLILGGSLEISKQKYFKALLGDARNENYYQNIDGINLWLNDLSNPQRQLPEHSLLLPSKALTAIRSMLQQNDKMRPYPADLWESFDFPELGRCPDCHPSPENDAYRWKETKEQIARNEQGLELRQQLAEEKGREDEANQGQEIDHAPRDNKSFHLTPPSASGLTHAPLRNQAPPRPDSPKAMRFNDPTQDPHMRSLRGSRATMTLAPLEESANGENNALFSANAIIDKVAPFTDMKGRPLSSSANVNDRTTALQATAPGYKEEATIPSLSSGSVNTTTGVAMVAAPPATSNSGSPRQLENAEFGDAPSATTDALHNHPKSPRVQPAIAVTSSDPTPKPLGSETSKSGGTRQFPFIEIAQKMPPRRFSPPAWPTKDAPIICFRSGRYGIEYFDDSHKSQLRYHFSLPEKVKDVFMTKDGVSQPTGLGKFLTNTTRHLGKPGCQAARGRGIFMFEVSQQPAELALLDSSTSESLPRSDYIHKM